MAELLAGSGSPKIAAAGFVAALGRDDIICGTHRDLTAQLTIGVALETIAIRLVNT